MDLGSTLRRPPAHVGKVYELTGPKSLVELHGGSVTARSDGTGPGAEFIVRLPA